MNLEKCYVYMLHFVQIYVSSKTGLNVVTQWNCTKLSGEKQQQIGKYIGRS